MFWNLTNPLNTTVFHLDILIETFGNTPIDQ